VFTLQYRTQNYDPEKTFSASYLSQNHIGVTHSKFYNVP